MSRRLAALVLCMALPLPAIAHTHVVAELGTAPLVGQVASTAQLQGDVNKQRAIFEAAAQGLGLTSSEFAQFSQRIAQRRLSYVVIPRHLDAMSWRSGGRVHVLRDVLIPASTMGWEIDLAEQGEIVALFIPNKCGNLSVVRKPIPLIASAAVPVDKPVVEAISVAPALPAAPSPATPAPYASLAMSSPSAPAHHFRVWPLLVIPFVALLVSHGHSGTIGTGAPPVPALPAAPTPPPAGCASPTPH